MILQALVHYYETLARQGKITSLGWCQERVSFVLELSEDGELKRVISLKLETTLGKKTVWLPQVMTVPQRNSRASGIVANFLCDNSTYFLGIDDKERPDRAIQCFEAAKIHHHEILDGVDSLAAKAVLRFFDTWQPQQAKDNPILQDDLEEIFKNSNLIFEVNGLFVHEDERVKQAWETVCSQTGTGKEGVCLVTGQHTEIARIHSLIKGVSGAQSSGAALVSFNAPAFESYGKEQSYNAPVGQYAVFAYTAALNSLIADRDHKTVLGDTTIVYWSEDGNEQYQNAFSFITEPTIENQSIVDGVFKNLEKGLAVDIDNVAESLDLNQRFYILGLAPNAARLAVRFFYQDSFGNILKHLKEHYDRMEIVRPSDDNLEYLGTWRMLQETVNKKSRDKKPLPSLPSAVFRAMLSGGRYPAALYEAVLGRIRSEQDDSEKQIYKITRGRMAIIKAVLLQNAKMKKEDVQVSLNEDLANIAYILGREFAVLERIQQEANPKINATIKDRYYNSACATPASIFPILFKLKNSHIRKLKKVEDVNFYEDLLKQLQGKLEATENTKTACPKRLTLEEQGMFNLGYYHQVLKLDEIKPKEEKKNG
ncbi:type I-C CRISPR-associated protein Cas8c/Csd1 [Holdemania filiformis]|uniref:type I-C CRISPR-associated protein Cas8c/Csd1 n=1 Tax=Holdemania filiformis TaxID=61171 RepID=UPI0026743BFE|nr:type I-C CRISPR-associated protein Cas8c/Csd1 [Holdemania filiformis]